MKIEAYSVILEESAAGGRQPVLSEAEGKNLVVGKPPPRDSSTSPSAWLRVSVQNDNPPFSTFNSNLLFATVQYQSSEPGKYF